MSGTCWRLIQLKMVALDTQQALDAFVGPPMRSMARRTAFCALNIYFFFYFDSYLTISCQALVYLYFSSEHRFVTSLSLLLHQQLKSSAWSSHIYRWLSRLYWLVEHLSATRVGFPVHYL